MNSSTPVDVWTAYTPVADVVGGFATGVAAGLALAALLLGIWQVRRSAGVSRELNALDAHQHYLSTCVEYPEFSSSELATKFLPSKTIDGILSQLTPESERYLWILSILLNAGEKVIIAMPGDEAWAAAYIDQISFHQEAMVQVWPVWRPHYSDELNQLVARAVPGIINA